MANPHLAAIEWRITSLNWSGQLEIRSSLDGTVTNQNVERYRQLNGKHLKYSGDRLRRGRCCCSLGTDQPILQFA